MADDKTDDWMATPKIDFPTEKDIEAGIKQCERKLQDEYNVNPLIYVMLEALINKKARASQAEEDYAKEGIKIEESYAYKKGAADERQRCIAEYKTLLERVLSEIEARKEVIRHDYKWMDYALDDIQNALGLRKSRRQS